MFNSLTVTISIMTPFTIFTRCCTPSSVTFITFVRDVSYAAKSLRMRDHRWFPATLIWLINNNLKFRCIRLLAFKSIRIEFLLKKVMRRAVVKILIVIVLLSTKNGI